MGCVMQGWGVSCRGGVCHVGLGWGVSCRGGVCHVGVGVSCRGGVCHVGVGCVIHPSPPLYDTPHSTPA